MNCQMHSVIQIVHTVLNLCTLKRMHIQNLALHAFILVQEYAHSLRHVDAGADLQEEMEAAIESAAHQTAQDLYLLLDEAKPAPTPTAPYASPLGKENMAAHAAMPEKKTNRGQASMSAGCAQSMHACLHEGATLLQLQQIHGVRFHC